MNKKTISRFKAILTRCIIGITTVFAVPYATQTMAANSYATQASPAQLSKLAYNMNANMAQRNLNTSEKNLYQQLYNIANNQTSLYDPSITSTIQQYESIRSKIRQQFSTVRQLAINTYGNQSQQKILLATNAFILMYYDALSRNNP